MGTSPNYINAASTHRSTTPRLLDGCRSTADCGGRLSIRSRGHGRADRDVVLRDLRRRRSRVATPQSILGATALTLPASMAAGQAYRRLARNFLFDFNPAPSAKWMRARFASSSSGSATVGTFLMGLHQRGSDAERALSNRHDLSGALSRPRRWVVPGALPDIASGLTPPGTPSLWFDAQNIDGTNTHRWLMARRSVPGTI